MDTKTKAPPQSVAEVDGGGPSSKKIKIHTGDAVPVPGVAAVEVIDVAAEMHLRRGDGIADAEAAAATVTVWWAATLDEKTERMHELTPEESRESGEAGDACPAAGVRVPVYALNYAALKEHGFETSSVEDVAFLSNHTLLNLST